MNEMIIARGFRLTAVAKRLHVTAQTFGRWQTTAPIDKLLEISEYCDIEMSEIVNFFRINLAEKNKTDRN